MDSFMKKCYSERKYDITTKRQLINHMIITKELLPYDHPGYSYLNDKIEKRKREVNLDMMRLYNTYIEIDNIHSDNKYNSSYIYE